MSKLIENRDLLSNKCERGFEFEVIHYKDYFYIGTPMCRVTGKYEKYSDLLHGVTNLTTCKDCGLCGGR